MLILFPPLILLLTSAILWTIGHRRVKPAIQWWVAFAGSAGALIVVLISRYQLPLVLPMWRWIPVDVFDFSTSFTLDKFSWPFTAAVAVLPLLGLLSGSSGRLSSKGDSQTHSRWGPLLLLSGVSLAAVLPGNLTILMLLWTALDLVGFGIWIGWFRDPQLQNRMILSLSSRLFGTFTAVWVAANAIAGGVPLTLDTLPPRFAGLLLLATGMRLSILPPIPMVTQRHDSYRSLGALLHLAPLASNLVLLVRISMSVLPEAQYFWVAVLGLVTLAGAIAWFFSPETQAGIGYWIINACGLALAGGFMALPDVSLAWGLTALLPGALIFSASRSHGLRLPILLLGGIGISSLPFVPTWSAVRMYGPSFHWTSPVFLCAHILLVAGYLRLAFRSRNLGALPERWEKLVYLLGLLLPVGAFYLLAGGTRHIFPGQSPPSIAESWPALAITISIGIGFVVSRRVKFFSRFSSLPSYPILSLDWISRLFGTVSQAISRVLAGISFILEGQAGVLWAFLIFILLVSLFSQVGLGG